MNIAVCLKLVPATTADIKVAPDGKSLQLAGVEMVVNPYDEYALEAALKTREAAAGSKIEALSVGGDDASAKCLLHAFAVGVDTAVHVKDSNLDARGAAKAAAAVFKASKPDVIFCGRQAIDDDQWLFPGYLGELLGLPHASAVSSITIAVDGKSATCKRRFEDGEQTLTVALPAVISVDKGVGDPRSPTLKGRLDAKKKQAAVKTPAELGVAGADAQAALNIKQYAPPPQKTPGKVINAPATEAAAELVKLLRNEAKII